MTGSLLQAGSSSPGSALAAQFSSPHHVSRSDSLEDILSSREEFCNRFRSLKTLILCGEISTTALHARIKDHFPAVEIWNLYSVSECHDVAFANLTHFHPDAGRKNCPIGKILQGVSAFVFAKDEEDASAGGVGSGAVVVRSPLPPGEVGELFVAGPTLARGYINLDVLTAQRFITVDVSSPFGGVGGATLKQVRMYKTGDSARVLPNRELEILGRCDSMQKVRGYSVELRAIEATIMSLTELVSGCVVLVQEEEDGRLCCGFICCAICT